MFEGNTLKNIAPKNGNTPTLSTDGLPIIEAERNLDPSFSVKDSEMPSAVMMGLSILNLADTTFIKAMYQGSSLDYDSETVIATITFDSNVNNFNVNYGCNVIYIHLLKIWIML